MQPTQPLFDIIIVDNALKVLIDQATGQVAAVQDAATGVAAEFLWSKRQIAGAVAAARNAWQSTADCFA